MSENTAGIATSGRRYRIGEFARLGGVSIKTLRFYDGLNLLRPAQVDARTRYRFYDGKQLRDLAAIRSLQDLGATLEDIRRVLLREDDRQRHQLLSRLRSDAIRSLHAARQSLRWLDLELERADAVAEPTTVHLTSRSAIRIASIRASLDSYDAISGVEQDLTRAVRPAAMGSLRGVLWHRCEASGAIEGEPFIELRGKPPRVRGYALGELPRGRMASAYCEPDDAAAVRTYETIDRWIHRRSLRLSGPKREIYLGQLLEIQFPVTAA